VLLPLYLSYLTPSEYGVLAISQLLSPLLIAVWTFGFEGAVAKYYYEYSEDYRLKIVGTAFIFIRITSTIGLIATLILGPYLIPYVIKGAPYYPNINIVIWTTYFNTISILPLTLMRIREEANIYVVASVATFLLIAGFNIYNVVILNQGVTGILKGYLFANILMTVFYLAYLIGKMRLKFDRKYIKKSGEFTIPLFPENILGSILQASDRFILDKFVSLETIGIYALARQFTNATRIIIQSVKTAYIPLSYKVWAIEADNNRVSIVRLYSVLFVAAGSIVTIVTILFSEEVIYLMKKASYYPAIELIPALSLINVVLLVYFVLSMNILLRGNTRPFIVISSIHFVAQISTTVYLSWIYGIFGLIVGLIVALLFKSLVTYLLGEFKNPIKLPIGTIFMIVLPVLVVVYISVCDLSIVDMRFNFIHKIAIGIVYFVYILYIFKWFQSKTEQVY